MNILGNIGNMIMLAGTTAAESNVFSEATAPIIGLIDSAVGPLIALVGSVGAVYCIILGAKLAKAEEPQDREKAKSALKNAIIGFVLIFVLLVALKVSVKPLTDWYTANANKAATAAMFLR